MVKKKPRNKFEKRINRQLRKAKVSYGYETEKLPYVLSCHYTPDFIITRPNGDKIYIETKGYLRPEDKRKLIAVKKTYPSRDIRLLFYRLSKEYVRWAERQGFKWAVATVPEDWLRASE